MLNIKNFVFLSSFPKNSHGIYDLLGIVGRIKIMQSIWEHVHIICKYRAVCIRSQEFMDFCVCEGA